MGCFGAIIGFFIGYTFLGFWGGFLGLLIGSSLGSKSNQNTTYEQNNYQYADKEKLQNDFITCLFSLMVKIASADGKISTNEANIINHFAKQSFPNRIQFIRQIIQRARQENYSIDYYLNNYGYMLNNDLNMAVIFIDLLCDIAMSDGIVDPAERQYIRQIENHFRLFGHSDRYFYQHNSHSSQNGNRNYSGNYSQTSNENDLSKAYKTLGLTANASANEIKKAYREQCKKWHPDLLQAKGLPTELLKKAEKKMQEINNAYEIIKKAKNIS